PMKSMPSIVWCWFLLENCDLSFNFCFLENRPMALHCQSPVVWWPPSVASSQLSFTLNRSTSSGPVILEATKLPTCRALMSPQPSHLTFSESEFTFDLV